MFLASWLMMQSTRSLVERALTPDQHPSSHRAWVLPRCRHHAEGFLHYADATVPLFQLALWLRLLPKATWTFVRYEDIFDRRRSRDATVRWLARLFDLQDPTASPGYAQTRGCNFTTEKLLKYVGEFETVRRREEDYELRHLFAPWQQALEALILREGRSIENAPPLH